MTRSQMGSPEEFERLRAESQRARAARPRHRAETEESYYVNGEPAEPPAPPEDEAIAEPHHRRPEPFETFDPITLNDKPVPERQWMMERLVPRRAATKLDGDGGVGKSILAMQALTAPAIGKQFLGRPTASVKTFGVFCEDSLDELHRRQDAINRYYGVTFGDLENMRWACRVGRENELMVFAQNGRAVRTVTFEQLQHAVFDFGAQIVTLDSLHDLFGGEEIARRQARAFMGMCASVSMAIDGAVIVLGHPSLSGLNSGTGSSGSTAWRNASRSALYLTMDPEQPDKRILKTTKANYVAAGGTIDLTWNDGVFVAADEGPSLFKSIRKHSAEEVFLAALRTLAAQGMHLNHHANRGDYAPTIILKSSLAPGYSRKQLETAMLGLIVTKKLEVRREGRAGHERSFLAETEVAVPHGST